LGKRQTDKQQERNHSTNKGGASKKRGSLAICHLAEHQRSFALFLL
jgi:hypothetical protein